MSLLTGEWRQWRNGLQSPSMEERRTGTALESICPLGHAQVNFYLGDKCETNACGSCCFLNGPFCPLLPNKRPHPSRLKANASCLLPWPSYSFHVIFSFCKQRWAPYHLRKLSGIRCVSDSHLTGIGTNWKLNNYFEMPQAHISHTAWNESEQSDSEHRCISREKVNFKDRSRINMEFKWNYISWPSLCECIFSPRSKVRDFYSKIFAKVSKCIERWFFFPLVLPDVSIMSY